MVLLSSQITIMFHLLFCIIFFCGFKFLTMSMYQYNDQENRLLISISLQDVFVLQKTYLHAHTYILFISIHPSFPRSFCFLHQFRRCRHTHTHTHTTVAVLAYPRDFPSWSQHGNVFLLSLSLQLLGFVLFSCSLNRN